MKLTNTTDIPTPLVRDIIRFCLPQGVTMKQVRRVRLTNCRYAFRGLYMGSHVLVRLGNSKHFPLRFRPYQYAQHRGRRYLLTNRTEALVYLLAHELRHAWQHRCARRNSAFPQGYVRNAKGRFSEVDTEAYAIHTLRAWRKMRLIFPTEYASIS